MRAIDRVVGTFIGMLGEKTALMNARKAPLEIDKDGTITDFYGEGRQVLSILTEQYAAVFGEYVARRKVRKALDDIVDEETEQLLPDDLQSVETGDDSIFLRLREQLGI